MRFTPAFSGMTATTSRTSIRITFVGVFLLAASATSARAQQPEAGVDSASAARRHYASARTAVRAGDLAEAQRMLDAAMRAWPTQSAYAASLATVAARRDDKAMLVTALNRLAVLEAGAEILHDSAIVAVAARNASVAAAHRRLERAVQPQADSHVEITLADSTMFPEGAALNPRNGALYVTSIRHRTIVEIDAKGRERDVLPRGRPELGAMLAVRVDADGEHLWATMVGHPYMQGYTAADSALAALVRIRISDGKVVGRWDFDANTKHIPGDLAVAPNGDVFISDSQSPVLYRLRPGAKQFEPITHAYFRSLQGMAIAGGGRTMYLADYSHGLLRLDLTSGGVQLVKHADSISTRGLDGIVLHGSSIIAVQNGSMPARIVRYELDSMGTAIRSARTIDRQPDIADEPTNGMIVGNDFVYIANSQWEKYDGKGNRLASRALHPPRLLRLPLGDPTPPLW